MSNHPIRLCCPDPHGCCTVFTRLPFSLGMLKGGSGYEPNEHNTYITYIHTYIHTCYMHTYYIHTYIHATYILHTTYTYIHTYIHATYILHTYIHTYIHTCYIHTHTQATSDLHAHNSERHVKHLTIKCGAHLLISAGSPFCLAVSSLRFQTCK